MTASSSTFSRIAVAAWTLGCFGCHQQVARSEQNVTVGALSLHVVCSGEGSPPVVLDSGLAADSTAWTEVQPAVARFTQVCAYDRAGLGSGSPAPRPHTIHQMAAELGGLLKSARTRGPYVLVDHSMGAVTVRLLANEHPGDVAGMVLLDSMTGEQVSGYWPFIPDGQMKAFRESVGKLPEGIDFASLAKELTEMKPDVPELGDKPLVVLVRGKEEGFRGASPEVKGQMLAAWQHEQSSLCGISKNGSYILAEQSGHAMQRDAPRLVVSAIQEVVEAARQRRDVDRGAIIRRAR